MEVALTSVALAPFHFPRGSSSQAEAVCPLLSPHPFPAARLLPARAPSFHSLSAAHQERTWPAHCCQRHACSVALTSKTFASDSASAECAMAVLVIGVCLRWAIMLTVVLDVAAVAAHRSMPILSDVALSPSLFAKISKSTGEQTATRFRHSRDLTIYSQGELFTQVL